MAWHGKTCYGKASRGDARLGMIRHSIERYAKDLAVIAMHGVF